MNDEPEELPRRRSETSRPGREPGRGRPEDILTPKQYLNYQHGRILSGLLVFFGCVFTSVCAVRAANVGTEPGADSPLFWAGMAGWAVCGIVGGAAALRGNRAWARLGFVFALPLVCGFPFGTLVSLLWMNGLSRYFAACERIRQARAEPPAPG